MKKKVLITAASVLLVGLALAFIWLAANGFHIEKIGRAELITRTADITEEYESVQITDTVANVCFLFSQDGATHIEFTEAEDEHHTASVENGVLKIFREEDGRHFTLFSFNRDPKVTVWLPEKEYREMEVSLTTGNCEIKIPLVCWSLNVIASTGTVSLSGMSAEQVTVSTTTGTIRVDAAVKKTLACSATTGKISVAGCEAATVQLKATTGRIEINDSTACTVTADTTTGRILLKDCVAEALTVNATTGHIELTDCDSPAMTLKTTTGGITGTLLTGKVFRTHTETGHVNCPPDSGEDICTASTTTGNIELRISGK